MKGENIEFISVNQDEEDMTMNTHIHGIEDESISVSSVLGNSIFKQSKNPSALFFHLFFKTLALIFYIFGSWFSSNFIFVFVLCILLIAFDFWTVKNISGRLLVGLRWWSYVRDDGSEQWVYESLEDMGEISPFDSRIFWGALYISLILWILLLVVGILRLKFEYLPIVGAALALGSANLLGYNQCSNQATNKMKGFIENGIKAGALGALDQGSLTNWVFSSLLNASASPSPQPHKATSEVHTI